MLGQDKKRVFLSLVTDSDLLPTIHSVLRKLKVTLISLWSPMDRSDRMTSLEMMELILQLLSGGVSLRQCKCVSGVYFWEDL